MKKRVGTCRKCERLLKALQAYRRLAVMFHIEQCAEMGMKTTEKQAMKDVDRSAEVIFRTAKKKALS